MQITSRLITHYLILFLIMLIIPVFCITFLPGQIWAKEDIVRRDTDEDGKIDQIALQKSLDKAVLQAIHAATPFPVPPQHLFKGKEIPLELTIAFELM